MKTKFSLILVNLFLVMITMNAQLTQFADGDVGIGSCPNGVAAKLVIKAAGGDSCMFFKGTDKDVYIRPGAYYGKVYMDKGLVQIGGSGVDESTLHVYASEGDYIYFSVQGADYDRTGISITGFGNDPMIVPDGCGQGYLGNSDQYWRYVYTNKIYRYAEYTLSDSTVKSNVMPIYNALSLVKSLRGVTFDYTEKALRGKSSEANKTEFLNDNKGRYGFIAQQVKTVIPELVSYDEKEKLNYLNTQDMIPILVEAIKEQQKQIDGLSNKIRTIQLSYDESSLKSASSNGSYNLAEVTSTEIQTAKLYQNEPNPFSNITVIKYEIPANVTNSGIYIYDMQGKQIKHYPITNLGKGELQISANELNAGMYLYSLLIDNKEIETLRMILTE